MDQTVTKKVIVPDLGGHAESRVIEVIVQQGEQVELDQGLITLESEKAAMEVPSPFSGQVTEILVKPNDMVSPGDVIAIVQAEMNHKGDDSVAVEPELEKVIEPQPDIMVEANCDRVHAGPFVRRIAREMGLDLSEIKGSGSSQQITPKDIEQYLRGQSTQTQVQQYDLSAYDQRDSIAVSSTGVYASQHLTQCWQSIPMVTHHCQVDITKLDDLRRKHQSACEEMGGKLTVLPILLKVISKLLDLHPVFNRLFVAHDSHAQIKTHHIGIAVDTPNGLLVPVLQNVNHKDIVAISKDILRLASLAKEGKLSTQQMQGGSTTISSLGHLIDGYFTPIINAPQASIFGVTKATLVPKVLDKRIAPRLMLPISLSYDHRVINGADAAKLLKDFQSIVDEIAELNDSLLMYN
jgi:pyruvate dehydrogenase E2 component (dihydrolipoamide acetyltransferase)